MPIVDVRKENREKFVKAFEEKGFTKEKAFSREEIINSVLPITLDFEKKTIGRIGNVTCAATARCDAIIKEEDFWRGETYRQVDEFWIY